MEPTIVEKPQMFLVGFSFFGDPFKLSGGWTEENEIGRLWKRFEAYLAQQRARIKHVVADQVAYEVHIQHQETERTGEFEVFVGFEVAQLEDMPVELSAKILPPTTYAIFTLSGPAISSDWSKMIAEWMSQAGYASPYPYGFQQYDERFKGVDRMDESVLDVYVPVVKK